jgi:lipoate-protein ligase A
MILWCDGAHDAAENMRRDAALLVRAEAGELREPVLRLFAFAPHGITLGASQDPARVLDLEACRASGVGWAVRPTGGRAIFHAEEWTYSLTAPIADPVWGGSLREAYAAVSRLLVASLLRLGVPVDPVEGGDPVRPGGSTACFASTAGHEIVLGARKIVGSAQRRLSRALLQQGSVLLGEGHLRLAAFVAGAPEARAGLREELERRTAHAGRWLGSAPLARWRDALAQSLPAAPVLLEGEIGIRSLTLAEGDSYTPVFPSSPVAPSRRAP